MDLLRTSIITVFFLTTAVALMAQEITEVRSAFEQSYTYETEANYSDAIRELKNVYDPASYSLNLRLGWLSYMSGKFTESAAYYQKSIELKPYAIEARFGLTYPAASMGNWAQVKDQYIKILEIDPQNTTANYYFGLMLYESGDFGEAAKHFEKVVNLYPFDLESLLMYAWSNLQLGKTREAEILFNEVLLIDTDNESALEGLELIK
jgi:tetratricopeptide (TPR) repeat protein